MKNTNSKVKSKLSNLGFTLAELLAVITILGIIALIVFPAVNKTIKNSKEKAYNQQVESILESAENWTIENMNELSETNDNYISITELKQSGYLEAKTVINPITDEEMNGCIIIKYDNSHNQYTYNYNDESCSEIEAKILPIITLNGSATVEIEKGSTYTDAGATATYKGIDISNNIVVTGEVNPDIADTYTLTYSVNYDGKEAEKVTRTVVVQCPEITLMGKNVRTCNTKNDDTVDQNLRYVGSDPNNYVKFNNELWRIIGVFDGQTKIIRDEEKYSAIQWHGGGEFFSITWEEADINSTLNVTYLNEIESVSANYIDQSHVWYAEALSDVETREEFYNAERGTTTWEGAIGLLYPSDYGYSTSSESSNCNVSMFSWNEYQECYSNSWLYNSNNSTWTIIPWSERAGNNLVQAVTISNEGALVLQTTNYIQYGYGSEVGAKPVVYLKPNVIIVSGSGTSGDPYILDIEE